MASLLKPLNVGAGVAPRQDPPSDDHYQPPTGPTAASSGSTITEQEHGRSTPSIKSDNQSRKRKTNSDEAPPSKRRRSQSESSSSSSTSSSSTISGELITPFDPASLVKSKEGTFKTPSGMSKYIRKHFKKCITKEEREALYKEHPRPDVDACTPPRVDKYITDFLGKKFPKEQDSETMKIQASVLAVARPLASGWQNLLDAGLETNPDMLVPAAEVLDLIQRTLCLVGNASEYISQTRRARILAAIDPAWSKFGSDDFSKAKDALFGEEFQSKLTSKVEKETALAKAVSITKRHKEKDNQSARKPGQRSDNFFRRGPAAKYGGRQGKSFFLYKSQALRFNREGEQPQYRARPGQRPLFHEPNLPQDRKTQQRRY